MDALTRYTSGMKPVTYKYPIRCVMQSDSVGSSSLLHYDTLLLTNALPLDPSAATSKYETPFQAFREVHYFKLSKCGIIKPNAILTGG